MISSVEITRFRGIREGKLEDLTPLVVLVGPNGCGKSSVLDALLIAGGRPIHKAINLAVLRHEGVRYGAKWLFWRPGHSDSCGIAIHTATDAQRVCRLIAQPPKEVDHFNLTCELDDNLSGVERSREIAFVFAPGHGIDSWRGQGSGPPGDFAGVHLVDTGRKVSLHGLVTETIELGKLGQVLSIVREVVSGANDIRILTEGNEPLVHIVYDDHSVPAALAGDGIYSLVLICLELATRSDGTALLEEPEVHQHPGAIRQTMRAILAAVRRDIQVVLTTHSLELIDCLLAESSDEDIEKLSLYRLELADGRLISRRVPGSEVVFSRCEVEKDLR